MLHATFRLYRQAYRGLPTSVWLLAGVMLINRCGTMVLPFLTLYLTKKLHYSVSDAGIVMAVYGLGAFVGTYLGGRLTDRFGFYYVQLISLVFSGAFLLLLQFVISFYALCGSLFLFTLLGDAFRPANQTAIAHYSDAADRTRAYSLNRLAINIGWSVGGALGGLLASINYTLLFWVDGLTCLLAGLVLWLTLSAPASLKTRAVPIPVTTVSASAGSPYRDWYYIAFVGCSSLYLLVFMQFFYLIPVYFDKELRLNVQIIGMLMALNGVLIVCIEMALVYRIEQQKWPKLNLIMIGVVLTAVSYASLTIGDWTNQAGLITALFFIILVTISEMLAVPFIQSFTVERANPATRGQYLALYSMGTALAQTTAPAFGAQLSARVGFSVHWLIIASIGLLAAAGFWWLSRRVTTRSVTVFSSLPTNSVDSES